MAIKRGKQRHEEGYGQGLVKLAFDDDVLLDEDEVTKRLLDVFSAPDYRPPTLPSVATELMSISQNPNVGIDDVTELLERDSMLTGRVMKLVRSPIYKGAGDVPTLHNAVLRLGLNTLRDIVLETCMNMRVFRADAFTETMERLREHSAFTGHVARIVCRYTAIEQEYAFLCGLLHDVGVAGSLIALSEGVPKQKRPDLIAIWPAIDRAHGKAGALMARLWDLPADVELAVEAHHQVLMGGEPHPLAATICIADEVAHELGFGLVESPDDEGDASSLEAACLQSHTGIDRSLGETLARAREALGVNDAQMEQIRGDARDLKERMAG